MTKALLTVFMLLHALALNAQNWFGNEWIRPGQAYLKLSISQAGVYRLSYQDIQKANAAFLQTNPANWQLFFK